MRVKKQEAQWSIMFHCASRIKGKHKMNISQHGNAPVCGAAASVDFAGFWKQSNPKTTRSLAAHDFEKFCRMAWIAPNN